MPDADGYQLVRLANGVASIRALQEGETFHPVIGPAAEAEALYVRQLGLAARMQAEPEEFVIWDVGLGGGANVFTVFARTRGAGRRLRVISFDHTLKPLEFALQHREELGYLGSYEQPAAELLTRQRVNLHEAGREITWEVRVGDFPTQLGDSSLRLPPPHVVLYDAYSPARNPAMWTLPVFTALFQRLSPDRPCVLPTYSRSTLLRTTLLLAGFHVGVGHATGEKEETTIASNAAELIREPLGLDWLQRAQSSTSAEPLITPVYRQAPLTPHSRARLLGHPQFRAPGSDDSPARPAATAAHATTAPDAR